MILDLMFGSSPRAAAFGDPNDERFWTSSLFAGKTRAGVEVDENIALQHSAVFRCSRLLTEPPSSLPIRAYRHDGDDRVRVGSGELPIADLLNFAPNETMTAGVFRERTMLHQVNWGNGFAEIVRDDLTGEIVALFPIHAERVSAAKAGSGFAYAVRNNDGSSTGLRRDEMLHVCGTLSGDGVWGRGVVSCARENIGGAIATERHGSAFFGSGGQPKGVVIAPGLVKPAERDQFRREWKEIHGSPESSEVVILPIGGADYKPITVSNQDNQFIESQSRNQEVICNWYGVQPYMLGAKVAAGSIEGLSGEFIIYSLYPWISRFEQQLMLKLLTREQRGVYSFEHDFSALLRGDITTRMNAYRVAIMTGIYTVNHCRRLENLPGIGPAGDVAYLPANMVTAEYMLEHGSGSAVTPGSDHTGAPGDNPNDHNPKAEAAFHEFVKGKGLDGKQLKIEMAAIENKIDDRPHEWREVARASLTDVLRRMFTKESHAALTAIDRKNDLEAWSREFYPKHEATLTQALEASCGVLRLAGVKQWTKPTELAAWLRARSSDAIKELATRDSKEVRLRKLAAWPTDRVAAVVDEVMG